MEATTHAAGLRELADWLDENQELLKASDLGGSTSTTLLLCRIDKDEFLETVQALGAEHATVEQRAGYLNVTRKFGPVDVQVYIAASKVGQATERMRSITEWVVDDDVREVLEPREPTDAELTRRGPHVMDSRGENDRSL